MFDEDARTALIKHLGYSQTPLATPRQEQEVVEQEVVEEVQQPVVEQMPSVDAITAEDLFASASPLAALPPKVVEEKEKEKEEKVEEETPIAPMMVEKEMMEVDPAFERALKDRVVVGDFEGAVEICFQFGRFTDALVIAAWSGPELVEQTTVGIE